MGLFIVETAFINHSIAMNMHQLLYNDNRLLFLCFKRKYLKLSSPSFILDQSHIPLIEQCRYQ